MKVIVEGKGSESLTKQHYVAAGGEGQVFQKGGVAFKIMHDGKKPVPKGKMQELALIQRPNVLIPQNCLLDPKTKKHIGYTMRYVKGVEFLCKMFNANFCRDRNISPKMVVDLVREIQLTLIDIHKAQCLVVDLNEMNFLVDSKDWKTPYFIDTDSYQTPNYPATALMESVRDRTTPPNQFSTGTDWFSFACVVFQLYMKIHPYKGKHPDFKPKDWSLRMDKNVSVFDPAVKLPPNCPDFGVIPSPHLYWFREVFVNKVRSAPPLPDGQIIVAVTSKIREVASFVIDELFQYTESIRRAMFAMGKCYIITSDGVLYDGKKRLAKLPSGHFDNIVFGYGEDGDVIVSTIDNQKITFYDWKTKDVFGELQGDEIMSYEGKVYVRQGGELVGVTFTRFGQVVRSLEVECNVFEPACKLYPGVAAQDIMGKCWLAIPSESDKLVNVRVKELDGHRIIDARFESGICVVIAEHKGKYHRWVITFGKQQSYTVRSEDADSSDGATLTVLDKGLAISPLDGDRIEIYNGQQIKLIDDSPIPPSTMLMHDGDTLLFAEGKSVYKVSIK